MIRADSARDLEILEKELLKVKTDLEGQLLEAQTEAEQRCQTTRQDIALLEEAATQQEDGQEEAIQELNEEIV